MKSQSITKEIRDAIWNWYRDSAKTQPQLAAELNLSSHSIINSWLNGPAQNIRPKNWEILFPHIRKYLPPDFDQVVSNSPPTKAKPDALLGELHRLWPMLSLSEKTKVLTVAAELLEKQGGNLQSKVLEKVN